MGRNRRRKEGDLRQRILKILRGTALDAEELGRRLGSGQREDLPGILKGMELSGEIARVRKSRYVLPETADLFTGTIQFHRDGAAHVLSETPGGKDLFISGENTFIAMHGDRVVARKIPGRGSGGRTMGRVIRILKRASETVVGTLQKTRNFFHVTADDPRFVHRIYVPSPKPPLTARVGDKVVVRIGSWTSREVSPEGTLVEVLGAADKPGVDMLAIIRKHHLPGDFPESVAKETVGIPGEVSSKDQAGREDFRERFVLTIDPDDARDFDDAIEVEETERGWNLWVHIADVSHYVRPGSALDREARTRGNSVYLADRVIPMLPESLSNGICSLRPGEDRLVFTAAITLARSGKVTAAKFHRGIIRSARRLTYKEALALLQAPPGKDPLAARLHAAWRLASLLRRKRIEAGALDLDFPEVKVWLNEKGTPVRLERIENDISHQLIEEFMLLANQCVAHTLKLARQPAIYRVHEKPEPDRLEEFRETALSFGMTCGDLTNRGELKRLLAAVRGKPWEHTLKVALLKSLKRARYATEPLGHYGLHKTDYAHFTSPIRRYADLTVHRALERQLGLTRKGPEPGQLTSLAERLSETERTAADAERDSTTLKKLQFFQGLLLEDPLQAFQARILDVRNFGFFVELPEALLSGLVHISSLEGDFFIHDPARNALVGRRTRKVYRAGAEIRVRVARVDMLRQQMDFAPV